MILLQLAQLMGLYDTIGTELEICTGVQNPLRHKI